MSHQTDRDCEDLERELAATRRQLEDCLAILRMVPDVVYKVDPDGHFVFLSDSVRDLGYAPEELLGKHFSCLIHKDDVASVSRSSVLPKYAGKVTGDEYAPKLFDERRSGGRGTRNLSIRLLHKNEDAASAAGDEATEFSYGEVMATGLYDDDVKSEKKQFLGTVGSIRGLSPPIRSDASTNQPEGQFNGTIGVIRNVTERHKLELQKADLQTRLFQARKMEAVGQLAAGIAHDFNNILGAISGYADLISRRLAESDPKLAKYAQTILSGAGRAADLTAKLLAFARRGRYRTVGVDLHVLITEVAEMLRGSLDDRVSLRLELQARSPTVLGDPVQLRDAFLSVATNARDAMPEGGELVLGTADVVVNEDFCRAHDLDLAARDLVVVSVSDTGVGMSEEVRSKIFEPFFSTKRQEGKGSGLGLASAYGIVDTHGGTIEVESAPGRGTKAKVFLPSAGVTPVESRETTAPVAEANTADGSRRCVLVVDDEEMFLRACGEMLKVLGFPVEMHLSARGAIDFFREHHEETALAIVDMVMPEMSGEECFRRLSEIDGRVKVVIATGYTLENAAERLLAQGVCGFLQKPFIMDQLRDAVSRVLER